VESKRHGWRLYELSGVVTQRPSADRFCEFDLEWQLEFKWKFMASMS
jgi:hypothetical protein